MGRKDQKIERYFKFRLQDLNQLMIVMKLNERIKEMRSLNSCAIQKIEIGERPKKQLDDYEKYQKHFPKLQVRDFSGSINNFIVLEIHKAG